MKLVQPTNMRMVPLLAFIGKEASIDRGCLDSLFTELIMVPLTELSHVMTELYHFIYTGSQIRILVSHSFFTLI
jgi:hypothetical protein